MKTLVVLLFTLLATPVLAQTDYLGSFECEVTITGQSTKTFGAVSFTLKTEFPDFWQNCTTNPDWELSVCYSTDPQTFNCGLVSALGTEMGELAKCSFATDRVVEGNEISFVVTDSSDVEANPTEVEISVESSCLPTGLHGVRKCGDTDNDGLLLANDPVFAVAKLIGLETSERPCNDDGYPICGDANNDGRVLINDALLSVYALIGDPRETDYCAVD